MLDFWVQSCQTVSAHKAEFYSGARKIIRNLTLTYKPETPEPYEARSSRLVREADVLKIGDCGYTKSKLTMLRKYYYVAESITAAQALWKKRCEQAKYGSVGFSTFGHLTKGGGIDAKRSIRASVMGPCIIGVTLTWAQKRTTVDVFYRTSELFKKWPADLVFLRDQLLNQFDFTSAPIADIRFHFANATAHPMYAVTFLPHLEDPCHWLDALRKRDKYFYDWTVKWSARYLCEEYSRGILKFSQALRVRKDAMARLDKSALRNLQKYLRKNHPGYSRDYEDDDDDE